MSFHHFNRLTEHGKLQGLTPNQALIAQTLAARQNDNPNTPFRASARYLSELTGRSENSINKDAQFLVKLGLFSSESDNRRRGNIYRLLFECPADCYRIKNHYSRAELAIAKGSATNPESPVMGSFEVENKDREQSNNSLSTPKQGVLIEHIQPIQPIEPDKTSDSPHPFTQEELTDYLDELHNHSDIDQRTVMYSLEQDYRAYQVALEIIRNAQSQRRVSDPLAYIGKIFTGDKPLRLLAGVPGTTPRNPKGKVKGASESKSSGQSYEHRISDLCASLGIDYTEEFLGTYRERTLRELHSKGELTASGVVELYNSTRSTSEWLELVDNFY